MSQDPSGEVNLFSTSEYTFHPGPWCVFYIYIKGVWQRLSPKATNNSSYTTSHTDGGVNRAGPTASLSGAVRVKFLAQRHLDTQFGGAGIELAFQLQVNLLYLLSYAHPYVFSLI